jgi:hypothetical protein
MAQPGAPSQDDQVRIGRLAPFADLPLDVVDLVADHRAADDLAGDACEFLAYFLAAFIGALTARPFGAHGQDARTEAHPMKSRSPHPALPRTPGRESAGG